MPRSVVGAILCLAMLTAACAPAARLPSAAVERATSAPAYVYRCADGFRFGARLRGDSAVVSLPTRVVSLPRTAAASGTRYAAAGVVFWSAGDEASLETPSGSHGDCRGQAAATPWDESRLLGYEFRAIGQEPGWMLEIDQGRSIRFIGDYGERHVHAPVSATEREGTDRVTYRARTGTTDLAVTIEPRDCRDVMSGEAMPYAVTVELNGTRYRGCGRVLSTGELTDIHWRLTALGREPVATLPAGRDPHMRLHGEDRRVVGFTTCNRFFGRYETSGGDRIRFVELGSTKMACVDPALARQEQRFMTALQRVNRFAIAGDTLTLFENERPAVRFVAVP